MIAESTIREALTEMEAAGPLLQACADAVRDNYADDHQDEDYLAAARVVIQTIIDRTNSPRTVEELNRILAGAV